MRERCNNFIAYKNKSYSGVIISHASRVNAQTRSILARAQINNENLDQMKNLEKVFCLG